MTKIFLSTFPIDRLPFGKASRKFDSNLFPMGQDENPTVLKRRSLQRLSWQNLSQKYCLKKKSLVLEKKVWAEMKNICLTVSKYQPVCQKNCLWRKDFFPIYIFTKMWIFHYFKLQTFLASILKTICFKNIC